MKTPDLRRGVGELLDAGVPAAVVAWNARRQRDNLLAAVVHTPGGRLATANVRAYDEQHAAADHDD